MDVRLKKRLWQSGKSKNYLMIELYEDPYNPDLSIDWEKEVHETLKPYRELGWRYVEYLCSEYRFIILLKNQAISQ